MHSALVTESHGSLYASDYPPGVEPKPQQSVDVVLTFQDKAETRRVYDLLSENGDIIQEFGPTFFSPGYAMFQDQFGTHWILMTEQA
jgi:PhnB protein